MYSLPCPAPALLLSDQPLDRQGRPVVQKSTKWINLAEQPQRVPACALLCPADILTSSVESACMA